MVYDVRVLWVAITGRPTTDEFDGSWYCSMNTATNSATLSNWCCSETSYTIKRIGAALHSSTGSRMYSTGTHKPGSQ